MYTGDGLTKYLQKNSANKFGRKTGFKIENEIEDQVQSIPKLIVILTQVFCTFGPNFVVLAWTGDELLCRKAQNGVTFDFEVKFDPEGQSQSHPKTIGILTKVFYTYGLNLVILAWTDDELSRWQAGGWRTRTDTHTDRQTQATTIPEGQNWPRVKMDNCIWLFSVSSSWCLYVIFGSSSSNWLCYCAIRWKLVSHCHQLNRLISERGKRWMHIIYSAFFYHRYHWNFDWTKFRTPVECRGWMGYIWYAFYEALTNGSSDEKYFHQFVEGVIITVRN